MKANRVAPGANVPNTRADTTPSPVSPGFEEGVINYPNNPQPDTPDGQPPADDTTPPPDDMPEEQHFTGPYAAGLQRLHSPMYSPEEMLLSVQPLLEMRKGKYGGDPSKAPGATSASFVQGLGILAAIAKIYSAFGLGGKGGGTGAPGGGTGGGTGGSGGFGGGFFDDLLGGFTGLGTGYSSSGTEGSFADIFSAGGTSSYWGDVGFDLFGGF